VELRAVDRRDRRDGRDHLRRRAGRSLASVDGGEIEVDPDLIDSSHIGFAPLVGSVSLPSRERSRNGA